MSEFELDLFINGIEDAHDHAECMNTSYSSFDEWNFPVSHWESVVSYHMFHDVDCPF